MANARRHFIVRDHLQKFLREGLRQDGDEHGAGGFDRGGGHVGFDRGLIGPGFESEEPAGLLAVFEQRIVLAAGLLPGAGDELDQELAPVFPARGRCSRPLVAGGDGAQIPCCWGRWHKQVFAAVRLSDSMNWGA